MNASPPGKRAHTSHPAHFLPACFLLIVIGATVAHFVLTAPRFQVSRIRVQGLERVQLGEILSPVSGVVGQSLFDIRLKGLHGSMVQHPFVRRARVMRKLPSELVILVNERRPYALLEAEAGLVQVDREGIILGAAEQPTSGKALARIRGIDPRRSPRLLQAALTIIADTKAVELEPSLVQYHQGPEGFVVHTREGTRIVLGQKPQGAIPVYLPPVLEDLQKRGEKAAAIDLRFVGQVVVTPSGS